MFIQESLYSLYQKKVRKHYPHGQGHAQLNHGIRYGEKEGEQDTAEERSKLLSEQTGDKITEEDGKYIIHSAETPPKTYEFDNWDDVESFEHKRYTEMPKPEEGEPVVLPSLPPKQVEEPSKITPKKEEPKKEQKPVTVTKKPEPKPLPPPPLPPLKPSAPAKKKPIPAIPPQSAEYELAEKQAAKTTQAQAKEKGLTTSTSHNKVVITLPDGSTKTFDDWQDAQEYVDSYESPAIPVKESYRNYRKQLYEATRIY